jgi:hypothetical protein
LLEVGEFTEEDFKNPLPDFQFTWRLGGTIFGGGKEVLLKWHEKYYEMVEIFIRHGRFIGKDQNVMSNVYLQNRDMCELVSWKLCKHEWFFLQDYLL